MHTEHNEAHKARRAHTGDTDRLECTRCRLLEEHEDYDFWCKKKQHSQRINCGEFHRDFGDVELGYSFSSPRTHIWFAGYAIHADCLENCFFSSHNANIHVTPEHVLPPGAAAALSPEGKPQVLLPPSKAAAKTLIEMVIQEGADLPVYAAAVPVRRETYKGYVTELVPTAEFVNDCERQILKRDAWDVGAAVSQVSDPVSFPPTFPPPAPFQYPSLFWSFMYNQLLAKRLARDQMEQAAKDIAMLNRFEQYNSEFRRRDVRYLQALDRLAETLGNDDIMHSLTWPNPKSKNDDCQLCHKTGRHKNKTKKQSDFNSPDTISQTYSSPPLHQRVGSHISVPGSGPQHLGSSMRPQASHWNAREAEEAARVLSQVYQPKTSAQIPSNSQSPQHHGPHISPGNFALPVQAPQPYDSGVRQMPTNFYFTPVVRRAPVPAPQISPFVETARRY